VRVQALDARGDVQFADGFNPAQPDLTARSRVETSSGTFVVQGKISADWSTTVRLGASRDDYDTDVAVSSLDVGRFTTFQQTLSWQNDLATPLGTVLAAVEQLHQSVTSDETSFEVDGRTIDGLQLGLNGKAGPHAWQVNLRSDSNSQFGHQNTGALAYGFDVAPQWRLGASAGTSFVMPSFDDLYFPGFGNPQLQPQHGQGEELNLRWTTPLQQARLSLYENRFRDLIALNVDYFPVNVAQARIRGASLEYRAHLGSVALESNIDAMDPQDLTDGTQLPHRARNSLSFKADWEFARAWSAGARLRAVGQRYDDTLNLQPLGGYGLLGLHCDWRMDRMWQVGLRIDNVTDHNIEPAFGYEAPPRQWFLTLRYGAL
jgi:vitamin B12 transporter